MVALMKFTRDICRLLGLGGSGPPVQPSDDEIDCVKATSDPSDDALLSKQVFNGEEDLSEEEKAKRRTERRKAKRKRRRKRKKQVKSSGSPEQDEDGVGESELDDSESEVESNVEVDKQQQKEEKKETDVDVSLKSSAATGPLSLKEISTSAEEEPEWDVSSAFFANAASHIKPKGSCRKSKENKENEGRRETNEMDTTKKSASLTEKGIKLVQEGQYSQAVSMFTEAIKCDPKDYRFFGNRSYCYYCLEQYPQALADAERSIQLAADWPKGHFRKGSALMGMKRYSDAEKAMEQVLKLDKDCEEAMNDLFNCKVLQLMELGFEEMQSVILLEKLQTVQAVLASCPDARAGNQDQCGIPAGSPCASLWVGNVTTELTDKHLWDLFKVYGEIESIRVLHERFCAFVNFKNANMATRAMDKLNGYCIENTRLVVRHPDRRTQKVLPLPLKTCLPVTQTAALAGPRRRGPVNGDECYFWRTTGCHFGDKCRYKHIPDQKGKDRKPWQP